MEQYGQYQHSMETVKRERIKVKVGDCVSLPCQYWGASFANQMESEHKITKLLGRVSTVDSNSDFSVVWDIDSQHTSHMSLTKCTYENPDEPKQVLPSINNNKSESIITAEDIPLINNNESEYIITAEDFQAADQGMSSTNINEDHALIEEDFRNILSDDDCCNEVPKEYVLLDGEEEIFRGWMMDTEPGDLVHHKLMQASQRKFHITQVLQHARNWNGYDEDIHGAGTFVAWELTSTKDFKGKEKAKNRTKFKLRIKGKGSGRNLRQRTDEVAYASETDVTTSEDENIKALLKKSKKKVTVKKKGGGKVRTTKRKQKVGEKRTCENDKEQDEEQDVEQKKKKGGGKVRTTKRKQKVGEKRTGENDKEQDEGQKKDGVKKRQKASEECTQEESDCSDIEVDSGSEGEEEEEEKAKDAWKKAWKKGGWTMDPNTRHSFGPKIHLQDQQVVDELGYFIHFFPTDYLASEMLPAMNEFGSKNPSFKDISVTEFMTFLGLIYTMELVKLPYRRMYWADLNSTVVPNCDFSKHMTRSRFEEILSTLQMSTNTDRDVQVQDFINAVNEHLTSAITPGNVVTLDESMIKSFHRKLKGKIKIKRKPRPVGNEIKDMSDARSNIVIKLEMYEGKEDMALKEHVGKYGATCATTLRLTENIHGSGRIVIADSWFGSVKTAIALKERGLFSVMVVKTAHKRYPREKLAEHDLSMGEWVTYTAKLDGVDLQACCFQDLKLKQFISTCSTSITGKPRKTKHHGDVPRPQVVEFLSYSRRIYRHS